MRSRQKPRALGESPKEQPRLHTPFPGMMDPTREWTVKEGRWPCFLERTESGGVMHVPLGNSKVERKLRLQESAHATWTPPITQEEVESWGVQERTIEACEDGRIINLMGRENAEWRRVNEDYTVLTSREEEGHQRYFQRLYDKLRGKEPEAGEVGPKPTLVEAARLLASSRGYAEAEVFDDIYRPLGWIQQAVDDMHERHIASKEAPAFSDTVAYAQELERFFAEMEDAIAGEVKEMLDADMDPYVPDPTEDSDEAYAWGEMTIERVPLPERLRRSDSRRTRPSDKGAVPRYMHRLVSDQRVFGRKRKEKMFQGTLLIDHSGSMSLSVDEVEEILSRWPAVTIATYSGDYDGTLRIICEKGKRAAEKHLRRPDGGGNCVDGPALDWLAKQRGPRIWISDGAVSGQGEDFRPWYRVDAARKVNRGRIKRIEDVRSLLGS